MLALPLVFTALLRTMRGGEGRQSSDGRRTTALFAAALVLVGALAAAFAIAFRLALQMAFRRGYGAPDVLTAFSRLSRPWRVLIPALGGALATGLCTFLPRRQGGMQEIMDAVSLRGGRISLPSTAARAGASFVAIASGGSIGREGPLLHTGAALGAEIGTRFRFDQERVRRLIAAGTAAGFAAAYNTPLAAILFVLEVVTKEASADFVVPTAWATVVATWLTRVAVGPGPLYGLRTFGWTQPQELGAYAVLGALAALLGVGFMRLLDGGAALARRGTAAFSRRPRLGRALVGGLGGALVGLLAIFWPAVTGNGYEVIQQTLDQPPSPWSLLLLLLAKPLATTASVSSGSPGGVFTPSLFLGAALGGIVAAAVHAVMPVHGFAGGYVLVGMSSLIAATLHAPMTAAVLGFELSGDYAIVLPLLLATGVATLLSRSLRIRSIYG